MYYSDNISTSYSDTSNNTILVIILVGMYSTNVITSILLFNTNNEENTNSAIYTRVKNYTNTSISPVILLVLIILVSISTTSTIVILRVLVSDIN